MNCATEDKVATLTVNDNLGNSATFNSPDGSAIYCPPPRPYAQKRAQSIMSASLWGGKLRLFWQGVFGSTREDYRAVEPVSLRWYMEMDSDNNQQDITFDWIHNHSSWIYTDAENQYWLFQIRFQHAYVRRMRCRGMGEAVRAWVADNSQVTFTVKRQLEAYALSTAILDDTETQIKITNPAGQQQNDFHLGFEDFAGVPPAYGWHPNWRGTRVSMTTLVVNPDHDDEAGGDLLYDARLWHADVIDASATADPLLRFSLDVTLAEGPILFMWRALGGDNFIRPKDGGEPSTVMEKVPLSLDNGLTLRDMGTDRAPIYCFYTQDAAGVDEFWSLYYNYNNFAVAGEIGTGLLSHPNRSDDTPPHLRQGTWATRKWTGSAREIIWNLRRNDITVRDYVGDDAAAMVYKVSQITDSSGARETETWSSWGVNEVKTVCFGTYITAVRRVAENTTHPVLGEVSEWWAIYKIGHAHQNTYVNQASAVATQFAMVAPRQNSEALYCGKQIQSQFNLTISEATSDVHRVEVDICGNFDEVDGQPGPISLSTLDTFPRFIGFGTSQKNPDENLTGTTYNTTPDFLSAHIDYVGQSGFWPEVWVGGEHTGTGSGAERDWPEYGEDWHDSTGNSGTPNPLPELYQTGYDGTGEWSKFFEVTAVVTPITDIESNLQALETVGKVRYIYEQPPGVGSGDLIIDQNYPAVDEDNNPIAHKSFVGWV